MIDLKSLTPGSLACAGSVVSFGYSVEIAPSTAFEPAAVLTSRMNVGEPETLLTMTAPDQPSLALRISDWIEAFGVAKSTKTFAPEPFSLAICDATVASFTSYLSTSTIFDFAAPR